MSESAHKTLQEARERHELGERASRFVSLAAAIIAVLAALGTLFSHHRSISALTAKNQAILQQTRASDAYNAYEAKLIRAELYQALLAAGIPSSETARKTLQSTAVKQRESLPQGLAKAQSLEKQSDRDDVRSERILKSYETLEIATTFFEIAIILVSISALARTRLFLALGCGLSAIGIGFLLFGLLQGG